MILKTGVLIGLLISIYTILISPSAIAEIKPEIKSIIITNSDRNDEIIKNIEAFSKLIDLNSNSKQINLSKTNEKNFYETLKTLKINKKDIIFLYINPDTEFSDYTKNYSPVLKFGKNFISVDQINKFLKNLNPDYLITLTDFSDKTKINEAYDMVKETAVLIKNDTQIPLNKTLFLSGNNGFITKAFFESVKNVFSWKNIVSKSSEKYFADNEDKKLIWKSEFCDHNDNYQMCINSDNTSQNKDGNWELKYNFSKIEPHFEIENVKYSFGSIFNLPDKTNSNEKSGFSESFKFKDENLKWVNKDMKHLKITLDLKNKEKVNLLRNIYKDMGFYYKNESIPDIKVEYRKINEKDLAKNNRLKDFQYVLTYSIKDTSDIKEVHFALNEKFEYQIISNKDKNGGFKESLYFSDKMLKQFKKEDKNLTILFIDENGTENKVYRSVIQDLDSLYIK